MSTVICTRYRRYTVLLSCLRNGSKVQVSVSQLFDHWSGTDSPLIIIDRHWSPIFLEHLGTLSISFHLLSWNFGRSPVSWALSPSFFDVATMQRLSRATFSSTAVAQLSWFSDLQRYCETICWRWLLADSLYPMLPMTWVLECRGKQRTAEIKNSVHSIMWR